MWSYQIDHEENAVSVKRHNTVYMSVTFLTKQSLYQRMAAWMLETTTQVLADFPEEAHSFIQTVTTPYLADINQFV